MLRAVDIDLNQKITETEFDRFGTFPRASFDVYTADLYGTFARFSGFKVSNVQGSPILTITPGRLYINGKAFVFDDPTDGIQFNMLEYAPVANQLWAAIYVYGNEVLDDPQPTTFLTDPTTRNAISRIKPRVSKRSAEVSVLTTGTSSPAPQKPVVPSNALAIAYVLLSPTGVVRIEAATDNIAPSVQSHDTKLKENDVWRANVSSSIDTLSSNISSITARMRGTPSGAVFRDVLRDIANIKEALGQPDSYVSYGTDWFLDTREVNPGHVDFYATIEEGGRFPPAAIQEVQLQLYNPADPNVTQVGNVVFPKYQLATRLSNTQTDGQVAISANTVQTVNVVTKTMTRERIRSGTYYQVCSNYVAYASGGNYNAQMGILSLPDGRVLQVADEDRIKVGDMALHVPIRVREVWRDGYEDVNYTETFVTNSTVYGAIKGQTAIAPQDGWLAQVSIAFGQIAASGDVTLLITECDASGQPVFSKVLGRSTVTQPNLRQGYTPFPFSPMVITTKGTRYAMVLVTPGGHSVIYSVGNKLGNGSFFDCTDGAWAMPDPQKDLCFGWEYAVFDSPRVEFQLGSFQLPGGIAAIDILATQVVPPGTNLAFMVQINGNWIDLAQISATGSPLTGLPPLLNAKVVATGTTDLMPVLGIGIESRVRTIRPAPQIRIISAVFNQSTSVNYVQIETRLENWSFNSDHTAGARIRVGAGYATIKQPDTQTLAAALDDPKAVIMTSTFTFPPGQEITSYVIDTIGSVANVVNTFHVANQFRTADRL